MYAFSSHDSAQEIEEDLAGYQGLKKVHTIRKPQNFLKAK
jgi:hypothetical protein